MKDKGILCLIAAAVLLWLLSATAGRCGDWSGVDKTVVEKFAKEAGREPRQPFINTDRGDLLLFVFLLAGTAGGFMAGYCFRNLFGPESKRTDAGNKKC